MKTYSISNILVLIFWIFLIFLFLNEFFAKNTNESFKNTQENKVKVYNFNTSWCGHSKSFQPVWNKFTESIGTNDNIVTIDAKCDTNINDNLVKKYNIEGYPTVVIDNGKTFIKYSGERSVNSLRKAVNLLNINDNIIANSNHRCGGQKPIQDKTKIYNFNTSWCGHSKNFQPVWDKFAESINSNDNILTIDAKCDTNINNALVKKYNIDGYPTIVIDNGSTVVKYSGERSVNGLRKALNLPDVMVSNAQEMHQDKTRIINFNTSWCGYSVRFQPIWDQFSSQVADSNVKVLDVKCDLDENTELCKKYDVPGYPSILKVTASGKVVNYDGPRTVDGLLNFVKN